MWVRAPTQSVLRQAQGVQRRQRLQGGHELPQTLLLITAGLQKTAVSEVQL